MELNPVIQYIQLNSIHEMDLLKTYLISFSLVSAGFING